MNFADQLVLAIALHHLDRCNASRAFDGEPTEYKGEAEADKIVEIAAYEDHGVACFIDPIVTAWPVPPVSYAIDEELPLAVRRFWS